MLESKDLPLVLVTNALPPDWLAALEGRCRPVIGPEAAVGLAPELAAHLAEAEGLFTLLTVCVDEDFLARAPKLRVVSTMSVGVDHIDIPACTARSIPIGNTPGVLTEATADLAMALLLAVARRLVEAADDARSGRWSTWSPTGWLGRDLNGATLGIIGMGQIGRAVARRAYGFGMQIVYADSGPRPDADEAWQGRRLPLSDLLRTSDFVTLHVPLTPETRGLIAEPEFRLMKPNAVLINTSRGPVVDMAALYRALSEDWIAGAGLDVTVPEPLPPENPLYALRNCLIVPHIGSAAWGTRKRMAELACENLLAGLAGKKMPCCVNREVEGAL